MRSSQECPLIVRRADAIEQVDQRVEIRGRKYRNGLRIPTIDWIVQFFEQLEALLRDATEHASAIFGTRSPGNQPFALESIDESGDAGCLLDHPLADAESWQSIGPSAAQDAEDVVLLWRDSVRFDYLRQAALHGVGCA